MIVADTRPLRERLLFDASGLRRFAPARDPRTRIHALRRASRPAVLTPRQRHVAGGGGGGTAYLFWRHYITDNDGDGTYTSMSELKLLDSGASDFIAGLLDGDCSESSANSGDGAHRLTDGDTGSEWVTAAGQSLPSWVSFQIAVAKVLVSYKVRSQRVVTGRNPTEWEVQGSNTHPITGPWTTVHAVTGETGWGVREERTFVL